eukprot:g14222.t1
MKWEGKGASLVLLLWCSILEGVLLVLIGVLSTFWLPLPLHRAREAVSGQRRRLRLLHHHPAPAPAAGGDEADKDGGGGSEIGSGRNGIIASAVGGGGGGGGIGGRTEAEKQGAKAAAAAAAATAAAAVQGLPDLGRRYLDFMAQTLGQGHDAAAAAVTAPYCNGGPPRFGGGHPENFFIDVSSFYEVVLTTEWEADGFLAACMVFAIVTAEARRAPVSPGGAERPYPLRTVIVGKGKAAQAQEALKAMRQTELIPPGCGHIDVIEGSASPAVKSHPRGPVGGPGGKQQWQQQQQQQQQQEEKEDDKNGSLFGSCSTLLLRSPVLRTIFGRWLSGGPRDPHLARTKLRELLSATRRQNQRVLVVALKPPRDLVKVLLEGKGSWWRAPRRGSTFDHVDLFVSGGFTGVFKGESEGPQGLRRRRQPRRVSTGEGELSRGQVEEAMAAVNRVFVVQLDDLVRSHGFPRAIAPDRTPTLSAAMAGARGVLPACLRRVIAASNHLALTEFPDKVAVASAAGRYANEELRVTASSIAAAAVAEEPGIGRGKVAELGACMADLIASDFDALEAAGLSPATEQAVFRSLDVGMSLSDVAAAWALACQDTVCWESCRRVGIDTCVGRIVPLHDRGRRSSGEAGTGDYFCEEGEDFEDGGDAGGMGFSLGKGDVRGRREQQQEDEVAGRGGGGGGDGRRSRCGSDDATDGRVGAFLATGFADGFERLEDQEAGYAAFAAFLVRVLDQMP